MARSRSSISLRELGKMLDIEGSQYTPIGDLPGELRSRVEGFEGEARLGADELNQQVNEALRRAGPYTRRQIRDRLGIDASLLAERPAERPSVRAATKATPRRVTPRVAAEADIASIPGVTPAPRGTVIEEPGRIRTDEAIQGRINEFLNTFRPLMRRAAQATPVGRIGTAVSDIAQEAAAENPLARFLSDISKSVQRKVVSRGKDVPVSTEEKLLQALETQFGAKPFPERVGVRGFSGVGEIKTPFGKFHIDESGTLRQL